MILESLLFFAPAILTNLFFNIFYETKRSLNLIYLDRPLDFNIMLGKNRLLGESTTFGGLFVAILSGLLLSYVPQFSHTFTLAMLAYFGHAIGSFIKRRLGLPRGKYLPIIDHGDYIILSSIIFLLSKDINLNTAVTATIIVIVFQPLIGYIAYKLGLREHAI